MPASIPATHRLAVSCPRTEGQAGASSSGGAGSSTGGGGAKDWGGRGGGRARGGCARSRRITEDSSDEEEGLSDVHNAKVSRVLAEGRRDGFTHDATFGGSRAVRGVRLTATAHAEGTWLPIRVA
eukprot:5852499-Pleurochrysis_carterae.AAC.1